MGEYEDDEDSPDLLDTPLGSSRDVTSNMETPEDHRSSAPPSVTITSLGTPLDEHSSTMRQNSNSSSKDDRDTPRPTKDFISITKQGSRATSISAVPPSNAVISENDESGLDGGDDYIDPGLRELYEE